MSNLGLLVPLLITSVVTVTGWFIAARLSARQEREKKRRETRTQSMVEAFQKIMDAVVRGELGSQSSEFFEALNVIQLLGTPSQVRAVRAWTNDLEKIWEQPPAGETVLFPNVYPLVKELRRDLREELGLEQVSDDIYFFTYGEKAAKRRRLEVESPEGERSINSNGLQTTAHLEGNTQPTNKAAEVERAVRTEAPHDSYPAPTSNKMDRRQPAGGKVVPSSNEEDRFLENLSVGMSQWIESQGVKGCPACGSQDRRIGHILSIPTAEVKSSGGGWSIEGGGSSWAPRVQLICNNCSYVMLFGVIPNPS